MTEQIRKILDLLGTMTEGIGYVSDKLQTYDLSGSVVVMRDLIDAYLTIEQTLSTTPGLIKKGRQQQSIMKKSEKLQESFAQLVTAWEVGDATKANEFFQVAVRPAFSAWEKGLAKILLPLVQM